MRLRSLLESDRTNAGLAWLLVGVLVVAALGQSLDGEFRWAALAVAAAGLALVPPAVERDPRVMHPWPLLGLVALPALLLGLGALFAGPNDRLVEVGSYLAVGTLALLIAVDLNAFTAVELSPRFAVAFVVTTTMAVAAGWVVVQWTADVTLGTTFLRSEDAVMRDLLVSTLTGIAAGGLFAAYFNGVEGSGVRGLDLDLDADVGSDGDAEGRRDRDRGGGPVTLADHIAESVGVSERAQRLATRAMQLVLLGIAGYGVVTGQTGLLTTAGIPFLITLVPAYLWRDHGIPLDVGWTLWITLAVLLHTFGSVWAYTHLAWFDKFAHAFSGTVVAASGYALTRALDIHSEGVDLPERFTAVYVVIVVLALAVVWEHLEWASEIVAQLRGGEAALVQKGISDIALDIVFSALGGAVVAVWADDTLRAVPRALAVRVFGGADGEDAARDDRTDSRTAGTDPDGRDGRDGPDGDEQSARVDD